MGLGLEFGWGLANLLRLQGLPADHVGEAGLEQLEVARLLPQALGLEPDVPARVGDILPAGHAHRLPLLAGLLKGQGQGEGQG